MSTDGDVDELNLLRRRAYAPGQRPLTQAESARLLALEKGGSRIDTGVDESSHSLDTDDAVITSTDAAFSTITWRRSRKTTRRMLLICAVGALAAVTALGASYSAMPAPKANAWAEGPYSEVTSSSYDQVSTSLAWDDPELLNAQAVSDVVAVWSGTMRDGEQACVAFHEIATDEVTLQCQERLTDSYPMRFDWRSSDATIQAFITLMEDGGSTATLSTTG